MKPEPTTLTPTLGSVTARADIKEYNAYLRFFSESGVDDGAFYPAQDVSIYSDECVEKLRDFCNEILEARKKFNT